VSGWCTPIHFTDWGQLPDCLIHYFYEFMLSFD
jgi:hypothetical protein